jgi:hypothetical protein
MQDVLKIIWILFLAPGDKIMVMVKRRKRKTDKTVRNRSFFEGDRFTAGQLILS